MSNNFLERRGNKRTNGYYKDMSDLEYNYDPGLRRTELMDFSKSPSLMLYRKKPTQELSVGIDFHSFFLEPDIFKKKYVFEPSKFAGKHKGKLKQNGGCKEEYQEWKSSPRVASRKILSHEIKEQFSGMRDSILRHPSVKPIFESNKREITCLYDISSDLPGKVRVDMEAETDKGLVLADIKTCQSAQPGRMIENTIYNWSYHRQSAYYIDGYKKSTLEDCDNFIFIFVEKTPPYMMQAYKISQMSINQGRRQNLVDIDNFHRWLESESQDTFYSDQILSAKIPEWAFQNNVDEE